MTKKTKNLLSLAAFSLLAFFSINSVSAYQIKYDGTSDVSDNKEVTSIIILDGVKTIGNFAFSGCENLKSITISNSVKTIDNYAFLNCKI